MRAVIMALLVLLAGCNADRKAVAERKNRCDGNGGLVDMINATGRTRTYILFCKDGSVKWEKP